MNKTEKEIKKGWRISIAVAFMLIGGLILYSNDPFQFNQTILGSLWIIGGAILLFLPDDVNKEK